MKKILPILILYFVTTSVNAQIQLDSTQVNRIAKTCQLWGHLKYFHPYLIDNSINWEKAFTDHITEVLESENKEDCKAAIQLMLLELKDPVTTIKETSPEIYVNDSLKYPLISFTKDSVLLVAVRNYKDLEDIYYCWDQFESLKDKLPKASGVIFDLRSDFELTDDLKGYLSYYFPLFESYLSDQVLNLPGYKARFHDGYAPEVGGPSGGYASGFYVKDAKTIKPSSDKAKRKVVFIVNRYSEIPRIALALQQAGQGYIISTDSISDATIVHTVDYSLEDSVQVQLRLDELGIDYQPGADYLLPADQDDSEIVEIAPEFINGSRHSNVDWENNRLTYKSLSSGANSTGTDDAYYPDLGNRLLAAAKIWTVIDYFFAYKDLMDDDWEAVLRKSIPRFVNASDSLDYTLAVAEMYSHIQDGHGFIRSSVLSKYFGTAAPPVQIRFIENLPVVVHVLPDSIYPVREIAVGDVITKINGEPVESLIQREMKYRSASNRSALLNYISRNILNGRDSTTVQLSFTNQNNETGFIELPCYDSFSQTWRKLGKGRNHQPIITLINKDIGYADLDRLTQDMVENMFEEFKNTKAIIFDMRGYPNGTAWSIAPHLTNQKAVYAANFRRYSPMEMKVGNYAENLTIFNQSIPPTKPPYYKGLTIMLIDERTQSQAEHTGLFFEAANQTKFIGSQTAGANGDVTNFQIPGNITLSFSGHDVRHIDGRQLQKTGLVPDVEIKPTIEGIRSGKDEVLEKAIEYLNSKIVE